MAPDGAVVVPTNTVTGFPGYGPVLVITDIGIQYVRLEMWNFEEKREQREEERVWGANAENL